jgi:hypothetical protein
MHDLDEPYTSNPYLYEEPEDDDDDQEDDPWAKPDAGGTWGGPKQGHGWLEDEYYDPDAERERFFFHQDELRRVAGRLSELRAQYRKRKISKRQFKERTARLEVVR